MHLERIFSSKKGARMTQFAILMLCLLSTSVAEGTAPVKSESVTNAKPQEKISYEAAYSKAQDESKPLVVLVGADWCAACKKMKTNTIEPMKKSGEFSEVVFTNVDKDAQPEVCQQIMQGETLPQIIVFAKGNAGWRRYSLSGMQSEGRVKELIRKAAAELPNPSRFLR
jgi:thiol:disulfide interchange protein